MDESKSARVYSDSVLRVGQMNESKEASKMGKSSGKIKMYLSWKEWNIFTGFSSLQILQEIQRDLN